ncbi:aminotransferase class I/II-fold pyridoxal phosphate-dependent enzyme, partial [Acinetobacter baumannii]
AEFEARRDLILQELAACEGVRVNKPEGAFYVMADFRTYLGRSVKTDLELAEVLLERAHAACVPGSVFCADGFLRLSYANSRD